jgi:hypothetical protein
MKVNRGKKAYKLGEIRQATVYNEPVGPDHDFYTDFAGLRGDFEEKVVYFDLNVELEDGKYRFNAERDSSNKVLFYFGGAPGSGKTSELEKYIQNLDHTECFYCVNCRIDIELSMNDVEYMDILIFQLQQLMARLEIDRISDVNTGVIKRMEGWFQERERELKRTLQLEAGMEMGTKVEATGIFSKLLSIFGEFKAGIKGSREWSVATRQTFKNRFSDFASIFNEFVEEVNTAIRKQGKGREVLFIVDGLEKSFDREARRKLILDEEDRIRSIRAYTVFTLPPELMMWRQKLVQYSIFRTFPFVKLYQQKDNSRVEGAFAKFRDFLDKRLSKELFENDAIIDRFIHYSGGSPRELLRLVNMAYTYSDKEKGVLDQACLDRTVHYLASLAGNYLEDAQLTKLLEIKINNASGRETKYDEVLEILLEQVIVMEYNDGTHKRVNPIVEASNMYQQYVEGK